MFFNGILKFISLRVHLGILSSNWAIFSLGGSPQITPLVARFDHWATPM